PPPARLSSFAGGLGELMSALAARLGPALRLGQRVRALQRDGQRWRLSLDGSEVTADQGIVAIPAPEAAALLAPLHAELAALLRQIRAAPVTQVHLGVRLQDVQGDVGGFGLLSPGTPILGTLLPASLWPGRAPEGHALLSTLVGGVRHPEAAALP